MIHTRRVPDAQEEITPGAAMAGMLLNGVGVANRPVSLPPQCFAHTPLDLWCREGIPGGDVSPLSARPDAR